MLWPAEQHVTNFTQRAETEAEIQGRIVANPIHKLVSPDIAPLSYELQKKPYVFPIDGVFRTKNHRLCASEPPILKPSDVERVTFWQLE